MDVRGSQRLAADRPVAPFEFIDPYPGDRAHVLAFHLDHRGSDLLDQLLAVESATIGDALRSMLSIARASASKQVVPIRRYRTDTGPHTMDNEQL